MPQIIPVENKEFFCQLRFNCKGNAVIQSYQTDFQFKRDLDNITKLNPRNRHERLTSLINTIRSNRDAKSELEKWKINISEDVVKFNTNVLQYKSIFFHDDSNPADGKGNQADATGWNKSLRNAKHISSFNIHNWLLFYTRRSSDSIGDITSTLARVARPMGFDIAEPRRIQVDDRNGPGAFYNAIKQELSTHKPQFIMCITPSNSKDMYDAIKRACCLEFGIPSQVIVQKTLQNDRNRMSVLSKVAIQINAKMGGEIWGVSIPVSIACLALANFGSCIND
jgi:aubergine-like protein